MANINSPAVTALATQGAYVDKNQYMGRTLRIPFFIDNGVSLINSGDTITFTANLPTKCKALGVHIKTAGVGNSSALTFSAGGTALNAAPVVGGALDAFYTFTVAGSDFPDVSGKTIIGTVSVGAWDDGANDLTGWIELLTNQ